MDRVIPISPFLSPFCSPLTDIYCLSCNIITYGLCQAQKISHVIESNKVTNKDVITLRSAASVQCGMKEKNQCVKI